MTRGFCNREVNIHAPPGGCKSVMALVSYVASLWAWMTGDRCGRVGSLNAHAARARRLVPRAWWLKAGGSAYCAGPEDGLRSRSVRRRFERLLRGRAGRPCLQWELERKGKPCRRRRANTQQSSRTSSSSCGAPRRPAATASSPKTSANTWAWSPRRRPRTCSASPGKAS